MNDLCENMKHPSMLIYAVTIFISAFLLFQVQPMIAKIILPWFGGGAAVWSACLMFFQIALLLGYLYSHAVTKWLKPKQQDRKSTRLNSSHGKLSRMPSSA